MLFRKTRAYIFENYPESTVLGEKQRLFEKTNDRLPYSQPDAYFLGKMLAAPREKRGMASVKNHDLSGYCLHTL
jgi:hypothetical protein